MNAWTGCLEWGPEVTGLSGPPVLAVIARDGALTTWLADACEALNLRLVRLSPGSTLGESLDRLAPAALLCAETGRPATEVLRMVALYDSDLPVLMITDDEPETQGALDVAEQLWTLTALTRAPMPVPVATVLNFLARAGRRSGGSAMRLMGIG